MSELGRCGLGLGVVVKKGWAAKEWVEVWIKVHGWRLIRGNNTVIRNWQLKKSDGGMDWMRLL